MFRAGTDDIDSGSVNTAVTEDVGELGDVLLNPIEYPDEKMPQVMGKHLIRADVGFHTQRLHIPPNVRSADRLAAARDEDTS